MGGAYFVGRNELLSWINNMTSLNYSKIEQTASGVFACHVFDALFPGEVRLEKVDFTAKREYEFVKNYKILQAAFNRLNLKKHIDVARLIKGKYQDNLEFIQWIKAFFDSHASEEALQYDGRARREGIMSKTGTKMRPALAVANGQRTTRRPVGTSAATRMEKSTIPQVRPKRPMGPTVKKESFDRVQNENALLKEEIERVSQESADNKTEREFYFHKLRCVEVFLQDLEEELKDQEIDDNFAKALHEIKAVLYAADDVGAIVEDGADQEEEYDENEDLGPEEADHEFHA